MIKMQNFLELISLCKFWAKVLRPYTSYNTSSEFEEKLNRYRIWNTCIDGYDICILYTETNVGKNLVKSIQCFSRRPLLLPFHIVFKIGMAILGVNSNNIFFSFVRSGDTVFCWTKVEDKNGDSLPLIEEEVEYKEYMGNKFACIVG